jgi:hypothetical protein
MKYVPSYNGRTNYNNSIISLDNERIAFFVIYLSFLAIYIGINSRHYYEYDELILVASARRSLE